MQKINLRAVGILFVTVLMAVFVLVGCSEQEKPAEVVAFKSQLGDFTLDLPVVYKETAREKITGFLMTTFSTEAGKQIRIIEEEAPGYKVDEVFFEEELTADPELHVERTEKLEMETFGTVYGALIEDHTLYQHMFYYKFNNGENVATILFSQGDAISEIDETQIKAMITSLKRIND